MAVVRLIGALVVFMLAAVAWPAPQSVSLWRLDCGEFITKQLTNSCYLIRHGSQLMLWDAGFPLEFAGQRMVQNRGSVVTLREGLPEQLARLGFTPADVDLVALSHIHSDHVGQASLFPRAKLLIGTADWAIIASRPPPQSLEPFRLAPWISGHARKTLVSGDLDVFGDGSVVMLATPGHTPGHHSLLVRLRKLGPVLLTGDLYHSTEQARTKAMSAASDPVRTQQSYARFDALAASLDALVVIQHELADIGKLPHFPTAAD